MNKPIREGFVSGDDADVNDAKVIEHIPTPAHPAAVVSPVIEQPKAKPLSDADAPPPFDPDKQRADDEEVVWPVHLKLMHKPTRNIKNEIIYELEIEAPTAKHIQQCGGNPCRYDSTFSVITDNDRMMQMVSMLSHVHLPMLAALDGRDWASISFYMQRFFLPDQRVWSKPTPSSTRTD